MEAIEKLQEELDHYKKMYATGDVATRAYVSLVKVLEQHIDILNGFDVKGNIEKNKDQLFYERAQKIFKEMPEIVLSLKEMKDKLGIEYVEKVKRIVPVTPQSIAKLGN